MTQRAVTNRGGAAIGAAIARTSRLYAEAGDAWRASPMQEAGGCLMYLAVDVPHVLRHGRLGRLPEAAGVARKTSTIGWPQAATWTPCGEVGGDESQPTIGFSPQGPTHKVGTCTVPMVPDEGRIGSDGDNLPPDAFWLAGRDRSRPVSKKAGKT